MAIILPAHLSVLDTLLFTKPLEDLGWLLHSQSIKTKGLKAIQRMQQGALLTKKA